MNTFLGACYLNVKTFLRAPTLSFSTNSPKTLSYTSVAAAWRDRWDRHSMEHSVFVTNAGDGRTHGQYCYYVRFLVVEKCDSRPELNGRYMRCSNSLYVHEARKAIISFDPQSERWVLSALCGRFSSPEEAADLRSHFEYIWHIDGSDIFSMGHEPMVWTRPGQREDLKDYIIVTAYNAFAHREGSVQLEGHSTGWTLVSRTQQLVIYFVKGGWGALPPEDGWESGPHGMWPPPIVAIDRRPERHH